MGIIDHKFEIFGQRGDNGDFSDIIDEARSMGTQMCEGLRSASPMYKEMIDAALKAFTETVEWTLQRYEADEADEFEADDAEALVNAVADDVDHQVAGSIIFGDTIDGDAYDKFVEAKDYKHAADLLKSIGITDVASLRTYLDNLVDRLGNEADEEDAMKAERDDIINYLNSLDARPGYLFFSENDDIDDFDELWAAGKKGQALAMIEDDDQLGFTTLDEYKAFIKNQ